MRKNRIFVIGSGAREHALLRVLEDDAHVMAMPGSVAMARGHGTPPLRAARSTLDYVDMAKRQMADLVIVGPDAPLVDGVADMCADADLPVVGPFMEAAQLEGSKIFAKRFMHRNNIPTADFRIFMSADHAYRFVSQQPEKKGWVVKADGLAAGKGVEVTDDRTSTLEAIASVSGRYGQRMVIEERLSGPECSFTIMVTPDGLVHTLPMAVDHKRLRDGGKGPNTGGMGTYAPVPEMVSLGGSLQASIEARIVRPTIAGLKAEGIHYRGFLYFGIMLTENGPMLLEFNVRLGDPEAEVILPLIKPQFSKAMNDWVRRGSGVQEDFCTSGQAAVAVVMASREYPSPSTESVLITGIEEAEKLGVTVLHGATKFIGDQFFTDGGRVLTVVGLGKTHAEAREKAYAGVGCIHFEGMQFRTDIAEGL
jgi:phosphoribosylamine--glycine ligase